MGVAPSPRPGRIALPPGIESLDAERLLAAHAADADTSAGRAPLAVLKPRSTEEVIALVQWANADDVGVVPVSSSGRRRRGDTVTQHPRAVVADLSSMNRLVHADRRDKIAIIEPGVDFAGVDRLLAPHGLRAYRPLMPRAGKSVIASYLEREPLINANDHWDGGDPFGGTHLVLGNGQSSPTGSAATEGTLAEQLARGSRQMVPVGPTNLDLLRVVQGSQGSLAVMTWAAVYCERIPQLEESWFCCADTLEPALDLARDLLHRRLGNALFIVDSVQLAMLLGPNTSSLQQVAATLPAWTLFVSACASGHMPQEKMAWQREDVRAAAQRHGARLETALPGGSAADLQRRLREAQTGSFRDLPLGAHKELFFVQQLDRAPRYVPLIRDTLAAFGAREAPLGTYIQPMAQGVSCHIEFTLPFDPSAPDAPHLASAWQAAAQTCAGADAYFSRPYGRWTELAYARDGSRALMGMTKSILDPRGVMNPGRLPY
jgi:FAD/FMN-containing dehydrogenase